MALSSKLSPWSQIRQFYSLLFSVDKTMRLRQMSPSVPYSMLANLLHYVHIKDLLYLVNIPCGFLPGIIPTNHSPFRIWNGIPSDRPPNNSMIALILHFHLAPVSGPYFNDLTHLSTKLSYIILPCCFMGRESYIVFLFFINFLAIYCMKRQKTLFGRFIIVL